MEAQLAAPGMPTYVFVDSVDGRRLSAAELAGLYDDDAAKRRLGGSLLPAEIGCAASHLAAYRHIVADGIDVALVLEDDALLGQQFVTVLPRVVSMIHPALPQAVLLSHVVRYSNWGARKVDRLHRLCRPYEAYGAHAYLITRSGAAAMLTAMQRVRTVADDWEYFSGTGVLRIRALVPYLVGTAPASMDSQIGGERFLRLPGTPFGRWARKHLWQKIVFQLLVKPALRLHKADQTW
jgi:glycosyl transferase, family 25